MDGNIESWTPGDNRIIVDGVKFLLTYPCHAVLALRPGESALAKSNKFTDCHRFLYTAVAEG